MKWLPYTPICCWLSPCSSLSNIFIEAAVSFKASSWWAKYPRCPHLATCKYLLPCPWLQPALGSFSDSSYKSLSIWVSRDSPLHPGVNQSSKMKIIGRYSMIFFCNSNFTLQHHNHENIPMEARTTFQDCQVAFAWLSCHQKGLDDPWPWHSLG